MEKYKGLRNIAYICQKLSLLGGILWVINAIFYFARFFSGDLKASNLREVTESYGGGLIVAIVTILLLYAAGGAINLLLDIEANTRKTT